MCVLTIFYFIRFIWLMGSLYLYIGIENESNREKKYTITKCHFTENLMVVFCRWNWVFLYGWYHNGMNRNIIVFFLDSNWIKLLNRYDIRAYDLVNQFQNSFTSNMHLLIFFYLYLSCTFSLYIHLYYHPMKITLLKSRCYYLVQQFKFIFLIFYNYFEIL